MSTLTFSPSFPSAAATSSSSRNKPEKRKMLGKKVFSIPPEVLDKFQKIIQSDASNRKKKAITIVNSYLGKSINEIKQCLLEAGLTAPSESRLKCIIRVFNERVHEEGFVDRFLKEDVDFLHAETLGKSRRNRQIKNPSFRVLTDEEKNLLETTIANNAEPTLVKTARYTLAISQGLVNREIKQAFDFYAKPRVIELRRRLLSDHESIESILGINAITDSRRMEIDIDPPASVSLQISADLPASFVLQSSPLPSPLPSPSPLIVLEPASQAFQLVEPKEICSPSTIEMQEFNPDCFFSEEL